MELSHRFCDDWLPSLLVENLPVIVPACRSAAARRRAFCLPAQRPTMRDEGRPSYP